MRKFFFISLLSLGFFACSKKDNVSPQNSQADSVIQQGNDKSATTGVPTGFSLVESATGVKLYKKSVSGGQFDYILEVDLNVGAKISLLQGSSSTSNPPAFTMRPLHNNSGTGNSSVLSYWNLHKGNSKMFAVLNAQFFGNYTSLTTGLPAQVSFPIKSNGTLISAGFHNHSPYSKRKLEIYSNHAKITDYANTSNQSTDVAKALNGISTVIVGFHPLCDYGGVASANEYKGRTYAGIRDADRNGSAEKVYFYVSKKATETSARQRLLDFGCSQTMMFDGGGSSQMTCKGTNYVSSTRPIPSIFGILSK